MNSNREKYMRERNRESGFTLLELMITISIIGILAASVTYGVGNFVKEKRVEQHMVGLYSELSTLRARAIREDRPYLVTFSDLSTDPVTYTVVRDEDRDYVPDASAGDVVEGSSFMGVSGRISYGIGDGGSVVAVEGFDPNGDKIQGEWSSTTRTGTDGLKTLTRTIIFENDEIGTISTGAIFLKNTALPNRGYAIVKPAGSSTIKLMKWTGSTWYEM